MTHQSQPLFSLLLTDLPALDPVRIIGWSDNPRQLQLIVQCYDKAWPMFWGALPRPPLEFLKSMDVPYVVNKLLPAKATKRDEVYLTRIIEAVKAELQILEYTHE